MQPQLEAGPAGVTVSGYGEAAAEPDVLRVVLTVGCEGADVSAAMNDAAHRTEAVTSALRDLGVEDRDLRTSGVEVRQRHNRQGVAAGYRARHSLTVTCRDVALGGRLLGVAGEAAGNALAVDHVGLDLEDSTAVLARAREVAFADARSRAGQYAVLADRPLGEVQQVWEGTSAGPPAPRGGMVMMAAAESGDIGVEAGETVRRVTVTVTWGWA